MKDYLFCSDGATDTVRVDKNSFPSPQTYSIMFLTKNHTKSRPEKGFSAKLLDVSSHQVEHAAQHGQEQEGCLGANAVDRSHHCPTRSWDAEDESPEGVQVKLRDTHTNANSEMANSSDSDT